MKTVQQIFDRAQEFLKIDSDTIGIDGLEQARAITLVNDLNAQFFEEFYSRGMLAPSYMKRENGYNAVANTDLDGAVSANATTLDVTDATNLDSSGGIVIKNGDQYDLVFYTGKSSNQLTGVTGVNFDHSDAELVYKLLPLPSDFGRFRAGKHRGGGLTVGGVEYYETADLPQAREFAVVENGDDKYIWLEVTSGDILITYDKDANHITAITDTVDVPVPYDWYIHYGLIAHWKEIEDQDYNAEKEFVRMEAQLLNAMRRNMAGKKVRAGTRYFGNRKSYISHYA